MDELAIRVEDVSKVYRLYNRPSERLFDALGLAGKGRFKEHRALDHVTFDVKKGETVGIIGTNGSGKSTILKIITGVLSPTSGEVEIDGRISALLELGAGFNMEYTGIENVYLNGMMMGFSREEMDARLDDILKFADIGEFVNQPCKTYSSGMFVRLAFAVAINIDPEILIVDEALSVGDVFFQAKCYKKFEDFKAEGKTIIFVSHDISSVAKYCDRVILLNKGVKLSEGNPKDTINLYKKVLLNQSQNIASGQVLADAKEDGTKKLWKSNYELNPQVNEYGTGEAEIIDFAVSMEAIRAVSRRGHLLSSAQRCSSTPIFRTRFLPIRLRPCREPLSRERTPCTRKSASDWHGRERSTWPPSNRIWICREASICCPSAVPATWEASSGRTTGCMMWWALRSYRTRIRLVSMI